MAIALRALGRTPEARVEWALKFRLLDLSKLSERARHRAWAMLVAWERGRPAEGPRPARDKVPALKKYMASFDPRIIGLRGDGEETERAAKAFHVYYHPVALGNAQYTMDHSGFLYLMDPKGKFTSLITGNVPGHDLAKTLRKQIG